MTLGQVLEILALASLPVIVRRVGVRGLLVIGIAAWVVRYGSLVAVPTLCVALAGTLLHGVGIGCFTIGGQMYLDGEAPADRRAGAQALNSVATTGLGMLLGSLLAGELAGRLRGDDPALFLVPCLINLGLLGYFVQGFLPMTLNPGRGRVPCPSRRPVHDETRAAVARVGNTGTESSDG
jgi:MFS family permease